ncbi:MAG: histidine phosphatase family protein, partial [Clostridia bacterium]|nr:histidine phosphatase family protein [Clostridia bacterium]
MQSYIIHFIRHGMTQGNVNGQYVGVLDIPVCEEGIKKLNDLKSSFKYPNVQEIYSSPLIRCIKTAEIIYPNQKCNIIDDLRECDFGDWEGKTPSELNDNPLYHQWIKRSGEIAPPNGESLTDFYKRICKAFELVVES